MGTHGLKVFDMIKVGTSGFSFPDWVGNISLRKGRCSSITNRNLALR